MNKAFSVGYQLGLEKLAAGGVAEEQPWRARNPHAAAGLMAAIPGGAIVGGATMPKGERLGTFGHVAGGSIGGAVLGGLAGAPFGARGQRVGQFVGGTAGGALLGGRRIRRAYEGQE